MFHAKSHPLATLGAAALLLSTLPAQAQDASIETSVPDLPATQPPADRPFLYSLDPSIPASGHVLLGGGIGNVTRSGEERPIGTGPLVPTANLEVGILSRLSAYGDFGYDFTSGQTTPASSSTFDVGAHILLTDPTSRSLRLAVQLGYGRDFLANSTVTFGSTLTWDYRLLRLLVSLTAAHTFQPGADAIDLGGSLAATVELPARFRIGVEAVASDLEEFTDPGDEGGTSAFVGPTLGWNWGKHFQIVAGPAWGVGPGTRTASLLGRAAATFQF